MPARVLKTDALTLRVPSTLKDRLLEFCEREELTVSQVGRKALMEYLNNAERMPAPTQPMEDSVHA